VAGFFLLRGHCLLQYGGHCYEAALTARSLSVHPQSRFYIIAVGGFSHIVAGSVDCAFMVWINKASLSDYATTFFVPTLLGNVFGGTN
jgi:hypothetical protein